MWPESTIVRAAASGGFSSDRTIADYPQEIWNATA
jgi:glucan phosphorylase